MLFVCTNTGPYCACEGVNATRDACEGDIATRDACEGDNATRESKLLPSDVAIDDMVNKSCKIQ